MEYKTPSPKFQDIVTKTLRLTAKASELGVVTATTISIPLADLCMEDDIVAGDCLLAHNITDDTYAVPTIVGTDLVLTDAAIAATDVFDVVVRLK